MIATNNHNTRPVAQGSPAPTAQRCNMVATSPEEAEQLKAQARERRLRALVDCGFPDRQVRTPWSEIECTDWKQRGQQIFKKLGSGFLIALLGDSGTGKTQMAVKLAERCMASARYTKALGFFLELHAARSGIILRGDTRTSELCVIHNYTNPSFLVIDEASERGETEWEDRMLSYLIDERYAARKDTLLIANQKPEAFLASVGPRIASRLQETGGVVVCNWPSFRAKAR